MVENGVESGASHIIWTHAWAQQMQQHPVFCGAFHRFGIIYRCQLPKKKRRVSHIPLGTRKHVVEDVVGECLEGGRLMLQ